MADKPVDPHLVEQLKKLQEKYAVMGQDLSSYLDGLLYSDYLTYWDYIHLETLLSLQDTKTHFPDEKVFIIYHQITELYFKLILWELEQVCFKEDINEAYFIEKIERLIRYFRHLINSFEIMVEGLDKEQFLKFRMALLPSSGFQSAQYRLIEICSTDMINLVGGEDREKLRHEKDLKLLLEKLYWRSGATELASGQKTLTLKQFEDKYMETFYETGKKYEHNNVWRVFQKKFTNSPYREEIIQRLRTYDTYANINWPLAHLKSAGAHLQKNLADIKATGGTNWQKYLPPRFRRIIFFPNLWSEKEQEEWGRSAFLKATIEA